MSSFFWLLFPLFFVSLPSLSLATTECRSLPGDSSWPTDDAWRSLNHTLGGQLIRTVPLGSPCHDPNFDKAICDSLKQAWVYSQTDIPNPSAFVSPLAQNASCDPFTPQNSTCELGNYPVYVVNATSAADVAAGLKFARENNIRVIIKSTGHDLLGKSSGRGSLSIWMHSFNKIFFTQTYNGSNTFENYTGPAVRVEPGLQTYQVYEEAIKHGLRVIGGTCNTVAIGGGYTQGGGHSLLSTSYGLSADNVLEWEIVTASGSHLIASPNKNEDLYWALTGGGPGTWGVVLSVTLRAYPENIISGAALTFSMQQSPSEDTFWKGVEAIHQFIPEYYAQGAVVPYTIAGGVFFLQPLTVPDQPKEEAAKLIAGFTSKLDDLKIAYSLNITQHESWFDFFSTYYGPLPYGIYTATQVQGSRLLPEEVVMKNTSALIEIYKNIAAQPEGFYIIGNGVNPWRNSRTASSNSVLPAWRKNYLHMLIVSPWDWNTPFAKNYERQDTLINTILPAMVDLAPDSGVYMNEGNRDEPNWKEDFFGSNYDRLKMIKNKYDPRDIFYARAGVGSDGWVEDRDGRLCRV